MHPVARAAAGARLFRAAVFAAVCAVLSAMGHAMAACAPVPWWAVVAGFLAVFAVAAPLAGRPRSTPTVVVALTAGQLGLHSLFVLAQQRASAPVSVHVAGSDALVRTAAKLLCGGGAASLSPGDARRILANAHVPAADVVSGTGGGAAFTQAHAATSGMTGMTGMPGIDFMSGATASPQCAGLLPSVPMILGHVLAALATGWLLRRGDLALLRIARLSAQGAHGLGEVRETLTDAAQLRALRGALVLVRHLIAGLPTHLDGRAGRAPLPYDIAPGPTAHTLQHTVIRRGPPAEFALAA
ncbi:hypothetical protein [Streptomyces montanisoli]|nr:hypothetical protein [Streptomyces montanisoli]